MRLLDSNIVIYSTRPEFLWLRKWIVAESFRVSAITRVETLGYKGITLADEIALSVLLARHAIISLNESIEDRAISLRKNRRLGLGDALIAATALEFDLDLVTRNVKDFSWISNLRLVNPFDSQIE